MLVENVLANRVEYGVEESLTEKYEGSADGHFLAGEYRLRSDAGCFGSNSPSRGRKRFGRRSIGRSLR
jgi:hypothetical protein